MSSFSASETGTQSNALVGLALQADSASHTARTEVDATDRASDASPTVHVEVNTTADQVVVVHHDVHHDFLDDILSFFHVKDKASTNLCWIASIRYFVLWWIAWTVLAVLFYLCRSNAVPKLLPDMEDPEGILTRHHFGCFKTPSICCYSLFCPMLQWAETMNSVGALKMGMGIVVFTFCALLNSLTLTGVFFGFFTSLLSIIYRQQLRDIFGLQSWTCGNCIKDCLYVCLCPWCAIAQEAQAVRYWHEYQKRDVSNSPAESNEARSNSPKLALASSHRAPTSTMYFPGASSLKPPQQGNSSPKLSPGPLYAAPPLSTSSLTPLPNQGRFIQAANNSPNFSPAFPSSTNRIPNTSSLTSFPPGRIPSTR